MIRIFVVLVISLLAGNVFSQTEKNCTGAIHDMVKPFLGTWEEYLVKDGKEQLMGTLKSENNLDGCTISQKFEASDSDFSYLSFGYVNPSSRIWEEIYVFNTGRISKYQWLADGEDILMRRIGGSLEMEHMQQLRLTNIGNDSYDVIEEHSKDGGKTWLQMELTIIKRVNQ